MSKIQYFLLFSLLWLGSCIVAHAEEALPISQEKPFMIVRLNQPHIYLEAPLTRMVERIVQLKPAPMITIIAYQHKDEALPAVSRIIARLRALGIDEAHTHVTSLPRKESFSEIHLIAS